MALVFRPLKWLISLREHQWTPNQVWLLVFGIWVVLLTGIFHEIGLGSPGIIQYTRLKNVLKDRIAQVAQIEAEVAQLEKDAFDLQKSKPLLEREIRKTMGYVGENEIVFDFSLSSSSALRR